MPGLVSVFVLGGLMFINLIFYRG